MMTDVVKQANKTSLTQFIKMLQHVCIVETGTIKKLSKDAKIDVLLATGVELHDVELVVSGGMLDLVGQSVLVFMPRTPVRSIDTGEIKTDASPYSEGAAKCLLIETGLQRNVQYGYQGGNWRLVNDHYDVTGTKNQLSLQNPVLSVTFSDEAVTIITNTYEEVVLADGTYTLTRYVDNKPSSIITHNIDGTTTTQFPDSSVSFTQGVDGSLHYEISGKYVLDIAADGSINMTSQAAVSMSAQTGTVLQDAQSIQINSPETALTGGKVTINGSVSPTGQGAFCGMPFCAFSGAPHVGPTSEGA